MEDGYKEFLRGLREQKKYSTNKLIFVTLSSIVFIFSLIIAVITLKIVWGVVSIALMLWLIYFLWSYDNEKEKYLEWAYRKYGKKAFEYAKRAEEDEL